MYILELGMCLQKSTRILLFLIAIAILGGCGALDTILPATGTYKINAKINDTSLDDFSILTSKDKIQPFFENPVFEDPDITELVVFLKDSKGLTTGYKATYSLTYNDNNNKEDEPELQQEQNNLKTENNEEKKDEAVTAVDQDKETNKESADDKKKDDVTATGTDETKKETVAKNTDSLENIEFIKKDNEIIFPVKSLDKTLPFFPLPSDLPIGRYTLVFQVMNKSTVLYKYEKLLYYIADAEFSFEGIQVNLPGIAENSQFIQNGNVFFWILNWILTAAWIHTLFGITVKN